MTTQNSPSAECSLQRGYQFIFLPRKLLSPSQLLLLALTITNVNSIAFSPKAASYRNALFGKRCNRSSKIMTNMLPFALIENSYNSHMHKDRTNVHQYRKRSIFSRQMKNSISSTGDCKVDSHNSIQGNNVTLRQEEEGMEKSFDYTTYQQQQQDDETLIDLPKGKPNGYYIVQHYLVPSNGFNQVDQILAHVENNHFSAIDAKISLSREEIARTVKDGGNVTLPIALMLLDPVEYPSLSRARKSCRHGSILIHRGPLGTTNQTEYGAVFDSNKFIRGRVGDRVYPADVVAKQVRMDGGFYPSQMYAKPPFELPVIFEDDHFAIVNKPAGVVVYSHRKGGHGRMTVRAALPFVLQPPKKGTLSIIRRPLAAHRLDRPTSGLLLVAKTKPALIDITKQFVERRIKKTYTAIINGIPNEPNETRISNSEAHNLGVDVRGVDDNVSWQLIDHPLDEKSAVTVWRPVKYVNSLKADCGVLTHVEMKPKTGRYHQLRRHMSWVKGCPLVGDKIYDGGGEAMQLRERGLFLCSNKIRLDHPHYNTEAGRKEWDSLPDKEKWADGQLRLSDDGTIVEVDANINLPEKFNNFLAREEKRELKFNSQ